MPQRSLLCIEPDGGTVNEIRRSFTSYGFQVESIPNGEQAVEWARTHSPSLIVLSVEPRKVGYAICNKLKRSPSLREIPLILISSEETVATFEQHKRLKSRAEEYLLKPFEMKALLAKADRLVGLGEGGKAKGDDDEVEADAIEIADDEIDEVSADDAHIEHVEHIEEEGGFAAADPPTLSTTPSSILKDLAAGRLGRGANGSAGRDSADLPPVGEQFDKETQAAFSALEAGLNDDGEGPTAALPRPGAGAAVATEAPGGPEGDSGEMVNLQALWGDDDANKKMPWEEAAPAPVAGAGTGPFSAREITDHDVQVVKAAGGADPRADVVTPPPRSGGAAHSGSSIASADVEDALLAGLGEEVPPLPEEVIYDGHSSADLAAREQRISDLQGHLEAAETEKRASDSKVAELQARIGSLEAERQTIRREQDEQRDRMTQAANQGAISKERDLLSLREVINKKEKDILDLRDALDAKERLILDHKDKIRENERGRRDLEERTLGFEKNLVAANERVAELSQDREKSVEREKGLKARLDDAHEELRRGQDEMEALRKRVTQEIERGRVEVDKVRIELEAKVAEAEDAHRNTLSKATEEAQEALATDKATHQAELARFEAAHRLEVEGLQKRLAEELAAASERLQSELLKLRREHEKALASQKEELSLQLASERTSYEAQTEAKHRGHRDEVLGLRRRHEEELTAAEDRRQRDILEQEQRRVAELEQAENRRRAELQARDEEHHARVTETERRHLVENTELTERHRTEHDQAVGRAVRSEGELAARAQEIEQAYRRLAGYEADLDAARAELGDRDLKLAQMRDRAGELEAKVTDYEDQIVRAFQRLRADEKTTEKVRRALAVGLALLDERVAGAPAQPQHKPAAGDEAEKS